ncbi:MAG: hypothetical protein ACRCZO_03515 [Cetobacterium sp.]
MCKFPWKQARVTINRGKQKTLQYKSPRTQNNREIVTLLMWDTGEVRDRFSGMGRFKGLRVNIALIDAIIGEMYYSYNYMFFFNKNTVLKHKLYEIIK